MHTDRWMDRQGSFNRYSAGCEWATACDTKSAIVAGRNWGRVREKIMHTCMYTHTCARAHAHR